MSDVKIKFKGYVPEKLPSGEVRHRVRAEGNPKLRIRIPVGPEDPTFTEHYYAARAGQTVQTSKVQKRSPPMSADALAEDYLEWMELQVEHGKMSALTLKQRRSLMRKSLDATDDQGDRIGSLHVDLPSEAFVLMRDSWGGKTAQADNALKAFSAAYKWGKERGRVSFNPVAGVAKVHTTGGGAVPWSVEDIDAFLTVHGAGTTARRWLMLALFTGARIGDTYQHGRKDEVTRGGEIWLEWQPKKKGSAFVSIPLAPQLLEELRAPKVEGRTYLLSEHGRPYRTPESLRRMIQAWTKSAGLQNRSQHGVRKAMGDLLAERGCSQHQIMAVMAHTKPTTSAVYTKNADRRRMAAQAIREIGAIRF